jgi:cytochrome c553
MAKKACGAILVAMFTIGLDAAEADDLPKVVREVCIACHGLDGNGSQPLHPEYPKLAAKQSEYLKKQLRDYQSGKRKSPIMAPMAAGLTPEQIEEVANYYAAQPNKPNTVGNPSLVELGKKVYQDGNPDSGVPACSGCHLQDATGNSRYPHLAAQHAPYTYSQLKQFASSERENDRGLVMQSLAVRMTDAEMKAVAEYLASLK